MGVKIMYINLRDVIVNKATEPETYATWARAMRENVGCSLEYMAEHEPVMIPEYEWEAYARQLAEDIGAISTDGGWPVYCIDWERAARELAADYSKVEVDGTTYYYRSF
jgi:antirestriction protein